MAAVGMTARARPSPAVAYALASAALFGVSTPLARVVPIAARERASRP